MRGPQFPRRLTVQEFWPGRAPAGYGVSPAGAQIRIAAQWVRDAGFRPGSRVRIDNPEPGVLVVRLEDSHGVQS